MGDVQPDLELAVQRAVQELGVEPALALERATAHWESICRFGHDPVVAAQEVCGLPAEWLMKKVARCDITYGMSQAEADANDAYLDSFPPPLVDPAKYNCRRFDPITTIETAEEEDA